MANFPFLFQDHINLHFIGQVKRKHESENESKNGATNVSSMAAELNTEPSVKKMKVKVEQLDQQSVLLESPKTPKSAPHSPPQATTNIAESDNNGAAPPSTGQLKCNSCEIGFSHLSNFVAHKKYYCRGLQSAMKPTSPVDIKIGTNGKESPPSK